MLQLLQKLPKSPSKLFEIRKLLEASFKKVKIVMHKNHQNWIKILTKLVKKLSQNHLVKLANNFQPLFKKS